jgi:predicted HicB family RNase H-like nuclease
LSRPCVKKSLKVFLDVCKGKDIEPYKEYSGRFNLRILPELHAEIASKASAEGKSLNQWIVETLDQIVHAH